MKIIKLTALILIVPLIAGFAYTTFIGDQKMQTFLQKDEKNLEKFPDFEVELIDSERLFGTKDLRGKYALVCFWSVSCGICIKEIPALESLNQKFTGEDFEIVSLSLSPEEKVQDFREERYAMPWKHAVLEGGWKNPIPKKLNIRGIPLYYLIDPEGNIIAEKKDFKKAGSFISVIERYL